MVRSTKILRYQLLDVKCHGCPRYGTKPSMFPGCTQRGSKVESLWAGTYGRLAKCQTLDGGFLHIVQSDMHNSLPFWLCSIALETSLTPSELGRTIFRDPVLSIMRRYSCWWHAMNPPAKRLDTVSSAAWVVDKIQGTVCMKKGEWVYFFLSQDIRAQGD